MDDERRKAPMDMMVDRRAIGEIEEIQEGIRWGYSMFDMDRLRFDPF